MLKSKNKLLHKAIAFVLTFSLLATLISFNFTVSATGGNYGSGNGTASNPYIIDDVADLTAFATLVNNGSDTDACAKLSDTFNVGAISDWTPIGNANHKFTGVFDGNNKTITFNGSITDGDYVGLFGINEGTIKNVTVAGTITSDTELAFVGGVAGLNRGTITNCESSVAITANGVNSYAGGIAGVMQNGTIESCKNSGIIDVNVTNKVQNDVTKQEASAGGIVAFNYNGTVKKCENTSTATIKNNETYGYTGGIVGNNDGTINNCLNGGTVSNTDNNGAQYAGGIAGNLFTNKDTGSTATISNCLNTNASGKILGSNGIETKDETKGIVTNSYYKANNESDNDNIEGTTAVTENKLDSGEVTYKLNGETAANPVWGQTINESSTLPTIGATDDTTVYPSTEGSGYTNKKPESCSSGHNYENGVCTKCFDVAAKVAGYSVTLDGTIGLNFYFDIKNDIENKATQISYRKDTTEGTAKLTKASNQDGVIEGYTRYIATVPVDSDQMNLNITTDLIYDSSSNDKLTSNSYNVNQYLNKIYSDPVSILGTDNADKAESLKQLAQSMSTYGYYANEYFADFAHYESTIPEANLTITANSGKLTNDKYKLSYIGSDSGMSHYASSLQHLESIAGVFYVNGVSAIDNSRMAYRVLDVDNSDPIKGYNTEKYSTITKQGTYAWAFTDKIPVSMLGKIKFEVTFGTYESEAYEAKTKTKYYSPYGYIKNTLNKYSNDTESAIYKLTQALYHYSEAAADYFPSQNS